MVRVAVAAGALLTGVAAQNLPTVDQEWSDFKKTFGKTYKDSTDEEYRRGIFQTNLQYIQKENAKELSYKLGVNQFTDLLVEEWSSQYFGMKPPASKMYGDVPYLGRHEVGNVTLPDSVDWTTKGAVTPVKNQGQCGSCWSFSSTGAMEGAYEIANGKLVSLSEQQLVDCAQSFGEQGCNGGMMDGAFQYAQKTGMCTEESYGYTAKGGTCATSKCTMAFGPNTVTGYKDVSKDDKQALMSAVAQQPVSIAIEADKMVFQSYHSGVLTGMCGAQLDHGVLVVGYGTDSKGGDYWKVKNSWGATWGMEGYVLLQRGKTGAGECGILSQPSYPVIKSGPAPPSPPPSPPSPPPAPPSSSPHYEKPPCRSDEVEAQLQGADGELCAPHCDTGSCPTDVPEGTTARPMCALQDASSGSKYCALACTSDKQCPTGGSCAKVQVFFGVCVYPGSDKNLPSLTPIAEGETITV